MPRLLCVPCRCLLPALPQGQAAPCERCIRGHSEQLRIRADVHLTPAGGALVPSGLLLLVLASVWLKHGLNLQGCHATTALSA